jgi:hypothetical protein
VISGGIKISLNSRIDIFAKNLCLLLNIKGLNVELNILDFAKTTEQTTDLFMIEQQIFENTDSPDTIQNPTIQHQVQKRFKLSKYLAYYCTEGFDTKLNLKAILEKIQDPQISKQNLEVFYFIFTLKLLKTLVSYFLHFHEDKVAFSFKNEPQKIVSELKKVVEISIKEKSPANVKLNSNFLIKLMKHDYFSIPSVKLIFKEWFGEYSINSSFSDFFMIVLHVVDSNQHIHQICHELAKIIEVDDDLKTSLMKEEFLSVLSELISSNDHNLLYSVGAILVNLSVDSMKVKKWIVSSVIYLFY